MIIPSAFRTLPEQPEEDLQQIVSGPRQGVLFHTSYVQLKVQQRDGRVQAAVMQRRRRDSIYRCSYISTNKIIHGRPFPSGSHLHY